MGICEGRTVIVTGAGRGLGREYALAFASEGANVVVNDPGGARSGGGRDRSAADGVVEEIRAAGGRAIANYEDVADWDGAGRLVEATTREYGGLHSIVNISSGAGLQGAAGHAPYAAAKGGIASLTLTLAAELSGLGITVNAVAPTARTRMTTEFWPEQTATPNDGFDFMDPANVAAELVWLGSEHSGHVTGCVFEIAGGMIALEDGWDIGPMIDRQRRWRPDEVGPAVDTLLARRKPPRPVWNT